MSVTVSSATLFTPGFSGPEAWLSQVREADAASPDSALLPRATNRRATEMTRMVAHVLRALCVEGGVAPPEVGIVLGTVGGELQTTFECLALGLEDPPASSPLRFRNSLHNSLLGHLSIATKNDGFASAVAASRPDVVAMALLEGVTYVMSSGTPCAVIVVDERWPTEAFTPLAAGVLLSTAAHGLCAMGLPHRGQATVPMRRLGDAGVRSNPSVAALDLVSTLVGRPSGKVALGPVAEGWVVDVSPVEAP